MAMRRDSIREGGVSPPQQKVERESSGSDKGPIKNIRSLEMQAQTRTRQKWLEFQPENERILVQCDTCQERLRDLTWISDDDHGLGFLEPVFEECESHSGLFIQRVSDLTDTLNRLYRQR